MLKEIHDNLAERMPTHVNSLCATEDEVRLAWLLCEVDRLQKIINEVHAWAVCAPIAPPDDMAQNFPRIIEITAPALPETRESGHRFMTAAECGCDKPHCPICVGGLAYCTVCKGAEGSLPTNCPGVPLTEDQEAGIYERGDLDFKDGRWFNPLAAAGRPA